MPTEEQLIEFLKKYQVNEQNKSPWPTFDPQYIRAYQVNWEAFFPSVRGIHRDGEYEWDLYGDEWQPDLGTDFERPLQEALQADYPTEEEISDMAQANLWDICAWYQPICFFGHNWGIYIHQDCIWNQALRIARFIPRPVRYSRGLARALIRASTYAYFLHEQYHHKVESLGIRLSVVDQSPIYLQYQKRVYIPSMGTNDQLEEALANANSYLRLTSDPYWQWISWTIVEITRKYLKATFPFEPLGYSEAGKYLGNSSFEDGENRLHSIVHEASLTPKQPAQDWAIATRLIQSLFKVTDKIWCVITPSGTPILPLKQPWP